MLTASSMYFYPDRAGVYLASLIVNATGCADSVPATVKGDAARSGAHGLRPVRPSDHPVSRPIPAFGERMDNDGDPLTYSGHW